MDGRSAEPAHGSALAVAPSFDPVEATVVVAPGEGVPGLGAMPAEPGAAGEPAAGAQPDLASKVRSGALWSAVNTLVLKFANIAIMAVVARHLSVADFGVFAVAMTVYTIVSCIAELGVTSCLLRADVDMDRVAPTVATLALVSSVVVAVVMVVFAEPLSTALGSADAAGSMRILALAILLVGVYAVPAAEVSRNFRQDQQFFASILGFVPANALLVVMSLNGGGAESFAWSRVVGQFVTGAALVRLAPRLYRPGFRRPQARYVLLFGLPLAGANVLNFVLLNADYALVGRLLGAVELGTYVLAFNVASWSSSILASTVNGVAMTAFSHVRDDAVRLQRSLVRATAAIALVALPVCGITLARAPDLIRALYGGRWSSAAPVLTILCLYGAMSTFCLLLANVLSGLGHTRALLAVQVAWLAALVPVMSVGVHLGGIVGAAWAHIVIVCGVAVPVYLAMLKRSAHVRALPMLRAVLPALVCTVFATATAYFVGDIFRSAVLRLVSGGIAGGLVYVVLVLPSALSVIGDSAILPNRLVGLARRYVMLLDRRRSVRGPGRRTA